VGQTRPSNKTSAKSLGKISGLNIGPGLPFSKFMKIMSGVKIPLIVSIEIMKKMVGKEIGVKAAIKQLNASKMLLVSPINDITDIKIYTTITHYIYTNITPCHHRCH
jgi:hypothetical protein